MLNISERFWMLEEVMVFETGLVIKAGHISILRFKIPTYSN